MNAAEMLEVHRAVWDMPTLAEQYPEVVDHLSARYDVVFPEDFTGQVYVQHKHDGSLRLERMGTTDVREAVATLLEREVEAESRMACEHCGCDAGIVQMLAAEDEVEDPMCCWLGA